MAASNIRFGPQAGRALQTIEFKPRAVGQRLLGLKQQPLVRHMRPSAAQRSAAQHSTAQHSTALSALPVHVDFQLGSLAHHPVHQPAVAHRARKRWCDPPPICGLQKLPPTSQWTAMRTLNHVVKWSAVTVRRWSQSLNRQRRRRHIVGNALPRLSLTANLSRHQKSIWHRLKWNSPSQV